MNTESLRAERGARYGSFKNNADISQWLKDSLREGFSWEKMTHSQKEALHMVCVKMSRIVSGDPNYLDNWHDMQGFIDCALEDMGK